LRPKANEETQLKQPTKYWRNNPALVFSWLRKGQAPKAPAARGQGQEAKVSTGTEQSLEPPGRPQGGSFALCAGDGCARNERRTTVDTWTPDGESIVEHVAGVEDYQVALATYRAACERWPGTPITLRQGARVIEDSRGLRTV
jgi:hypothetical protein